jgi:solute:Na+ symporter, SSS family
MSRLPIADLLIIAGYLVTMVMAGLWFSRKNSNADQFTRASGRIPSWAAGISIYATFLSSNTFLGVPGKSFGGNWNSFVFSLSMPLAAWIAARYFIPFYRRTGEISAYTHLEKRFGPWARTYAGVCFLLTQLARMGSIFLGIALSLQALTGYPMSLIMVLMGAIIIVYTVLGGMAAVIWTEVIQAVIKTLGAIVLLFVIVKNIPGGWQDIVSIGSKDHKFSLGTLRPDFIHSSFWVVLLYGFFINLCNFGIDQNYVQRYQSTHSSQDAVRSLWLCVKCYVPTSLVFFVIGSGLYAYYQMHPDLLTAVRFRTARELLPLHASTQQISDLAASLKPQDFGDKVLPEFMVNMLPVGVVGLLVSAILSAAMSTISSSINASATVFVYDMYRRYFFPRATDDKLLSALHISTFVFGILGILTGLSMIGVKSILDVWWQLSGTFASGMLGLFLLGLVSRRVGSVEALVAVIIGSLVVVWMTFPSLIPKQYAGFRSVLNTNMIIVVSTLSMFLVGVMMASRKKNTTAPGSAV